MRNSSYFVLFISSLFITACVTLTGDTGWKINIVNGNVMYGSGYADMPYVVELPNGNWFSTLTVSSEKEGSEDQHIVYLESLDRGNTWSKPVNIESPESPESSWAMPYVDGNRIYVFYTYNAENIREWPFSDSSGSRQRVDMLGKFVFRYSDDYGETWSQRHTIPIRKTAIDKENSFDGEVQTFWTMGHPQKIEDYVYIGLSKIGRSTRDNIIAQSEAYFIRSNDIMDSSSWELLPRGERGFLCPVADCNVAEESNLTILSDGTLYAVFRTNAGYLGKAISRDSGETWETGLARFASGEIIPHPRAAALPYRFSNGKYVLWFHNHTGTDFKGRNPVWIAGGIERSGTIAWSDPKEILFHPDASVKISYLTFLEKEGRYWVTETNKETARIHEIDPAFLKKLWNSVAG